MSYFFSILTPRDKPLFELEFGTAKQGGDGQARFPAEAQDMNRFIVHASLDFLDDLQWSNNQMYLKRIDQFASAHVSAFITPCSTRFVLLHLPHPPNTIPAANASSGNVFPAYTPYTSGPSKGGEHGYGNASTTSNSSGIPNNPTSTQTEEAIRQFFGEVFEIWLKAVMSPFQTVGANLVSPAFHQRVVAAGKKYL